MGCDNQKIAIIGAGIAGLSAANALVDQGFTPTLIDAEMFPRHRVCGEFLSPESLPLLEKWDILPSVRIDSCRFIDQEKSVPISFPTSAGTRSRYTLDHALLKRAEDKGARIYLGEKVIQWEKEEKEWRLMLSSGRELRADILLIGTGRFAKSALKPKYLGFKSHCRIKNPPHSLEMHFFPGGYVGISPVDANMVNVAGIIRLESKQSIEAIVADIPILSQAEMLFPDWMTVKVPPFGIRKTEPLENVLWIGDAAGSIPPVCGEGLSLAIDSGIMAAQYAIEGKCSLFQRAWRKKYHACFRTATVLHSFAMHPFLRKGLFTACHIWPALPQHLFSLTRI